MRWAVIALGIASCSHPPPTAAPIAPESPPPSAAVAEADAPAPARASEPGGSAEDEERRYLSLEDVDWKNYTYIPGLCTLRDGYSEYREYSEDFGGLHDTTIWKFVSAATGSSATGTQVAIVLVSEEYSPPNGPGSKRTRVFVYQLIDRKVTALGDSFDVGEAESAAIDKDRASLFVDGHCEMYRLEEQSWKATTESCPGN